MQKKIIFILESISQPRCIKRVKSFLSAGYDVEIYGYNRDVYNMNLDNLEIGVEILGELSDGRNYLTKILKFREDVKTIIQKNPNDALYYSFGFGISFFMMKYRSRYIYEISDILYGYKQYILLEWLFKFIDKIIIKNSLLTVMTSRGFLDYFYKKKKPKNIIIQPNKLDYRFSNQKRIYTPKIDMQKVVFAYIGAFRYPKTVFKFAETIGEYFKDFEFHFYGDSYLTRAVIDISNKYDNVKYYGPFKNPEDLESIYSKIDITVACYEIDHINEKIAEPNKLYESLYFLKPIIVSTKTYLSKRVAQLKCGYIINAYSVEEIRKFLNNLDVESIVTIRKNIQKIELREIIDDNASNIIKNIEERIRCINAKNMEKKNIYSNK